MFSILGYLFIIVFTIIGILITFVILVVYFELNSLVATKKQSSELSISIEDSNNIAQPIKFKLDDENIFYNLDKISILSIPKKEIKNLDKIIKNTNYNFLSYDGNKRNFSISNKSILDKFILRNVYSGDVIIIKKNNTYLSSWESNLKNKFSNENFSIYKIIKNKKYLKILDYKLANDDNKIINSYLTLILKNNEINLLNLPDKSFFDKYCKKSKKNTGKCGNLTYFINNTDIINSNFDFNSSYSIFNNFIISYI